MQTYKNFKLKEIPITPSNKFEEQERCLRSTYQKLVDADFEYYLDKQALEEIEEIYQKYENKLFSKSDLRDIESSNKILVDYLSDVCGLVEQEISHFTQLYDYEPYGDTYVRRAV